MSSTCSCLRLYNWLITLQQTQKSLTLILLYILDACMWYIASLYWVCNNIAATILPLNCLTQQLGICIMYQWITSYYIYIVTMHGLSRFQQTDMRWAHAPVSFGRVCVFACLWGQIHPESKHIIQLSHGIAMDAQCHMLSCLRIMQLQKQRAPRPVFLLIISIPVDMT